MMLKWTNLSENPLQSLFKMLLSITRIEINIQGWTKEQTNIISLLTGDSNQLKIIETVVNKLDFLVAMD